MTRLKLAPLLAFVLLFGACTALQPAPELTWDHSRDVVIIKAGSDGGYEPPIAGINRIPEAQVWGDGRIVWTTQGEQGERLVWEGRLSEAQMLELLETFARKGFFGLDDFYRPEDEIFDAGTDYLSVKLETESKRVREYHSGAPRRFHELRGLVKSGAGAAGRDYVPERGFMAARAFNTADQALEGTPVWDVAATGVDLAEISEGVWVEGTALEAGWAVVNRAYWLGRVIQGDDLYEMSLQIPDLTGRADPEPWW